MHLVLFGATGLVGTAVLRSMISTPSVSKITILSRKPVPLADKDPKCNVVLHNDFLNYDKELMAKLDGAKGVVWALGVSQNSVNKKEYEVITKSYTLSFFRALATTVSNPLTFIFVSGEGATHSPGIFTTLFGRVKGETEQELLRFSASIEKSSSGPVSPNTVPIPTYIVRPGVVDWTGDEEIKEFIPKWVKPDSAFIPLILKATRAAYKSMFIPTKDLGNVLVKLATSDGDRLEGKGIEGEGRIVTNIGVRQMAGL